ncbi:MAG TPA: 2-dehydropantoate 2-reductase [Gemmatimonadaceae bacterium]|nr:2-dehydropantoate 2-reductase [Gemmatimonadaceae bacterium]
MRLLVLGAGGIGGYFGGRMAATGTEVTFLVRPGRRAQLENDGLRILSPLGDLAMPVRTVSAAELKPGYDLVLLTCKAYDLDSAMEAIAPAIDGRSGIVPLLNGMSHIDRLRERFGEGSVLGGTCSISVALEPDGVIRHANSLQRIAFGELDGRESPRVRSLADACAAAALDWELSGDITQNMWEKIAFLSVLAATNCLFRANVGQIVRAPGGLEVMERALGVNAEIASREGYPLRPAAVEFARKTLMNPASTIRGSMLHDLESGAQVEADHIIGWMLARARHHGLDDTILSLAYTSLKAYEDRRASP